MPSPRTWMNPPPGAAQPQRPRPTAGLPAEQPLGRGRAHLDTQPRWYGRLRRWRRRVRSPVMPTSSCGSFSRNNAPRGAERVSIPGMISGNVRLFNGQVVPVIHPEIRGMCNWTTDALIQAVAGAPPALVGARPADKQAYADKVGGIRSFLERLYYELRNLGITPQERAMNYAGANAFHIESGV